MLNLNTFRADPTGGSTLYGLIVWDDIVGTLFSLAI